MEKEMATHSSVLAWRIPGMGSLVGCHLWGRTEPDTTDVTQQQQQQKWTRIVKFLFLQLLKLSGSMELPCFQEYNYNITQFFINCT